VVLASLLLVLIGRIYTDNQGTAGNNSAQQAATPQNWYANGNAYAVANYKAGDTAYLEGYSQSRVNSLEDTQSIGAPK